MHRTRELHDKHDRSDPRPWPTDPAQYPLSGPRTGAVYVPPRRELDWPGPWLIFLYAMACGAGAGLIVLAYLAIVL